MCMLVRVAPPRLGSQFYTRPHARNSGFGALLKCTWAVLSGVVAPSMLCLVWGLNQEPSVSLFSAQPLAPSPPLASTHNCDQFYFYLGNDNDFRLNSKMVQQSS